MEHVVPAEQKNRGEGGDDWAWCRESSSSPPLRLRLSSQLHADDEDGLAGPAGRLCAPREPPVLRGFGKRPGGAQRLPRETRPPGLRQVPERVLEPAALWLSHAAARARSRPPLAPVLVGAPRCDRRGTPFRPLAFVLARCSRRVHPGFGHPTSRTTIRRRGEAAGTTEDRLGPVRS